MAPTGCSPPRKAAAMPLKPMLGRDDRAHSHCSNPLRYKNAAPIPARAPAITMVRITL